MEDLIQKYEERENGSDAREEALAFFQNNTLSYGEVLLFVKSKSGLLVWEFAEIFISMYPCSLKTALMLVEQTDYHHRVIGAIIKKKGLCSLQKACWLCGESSEVVLERGYLSHLIMQRDDWKNAPVGRRLTLWLNYLPDYSLEDCGVMKNIMSDSNFTEKHQRIWEEFIEEEASAILSYNS